MAKGKKTQLCAQGETGCKKPSGTVTWVFCESCEQWYHCPCVSVDSKKANDDDFIFICKSCKPQKEKEFNAMKNDLKKQIGLIMDRHPVFSTALIARRCFATKSASNEYHFGRPGIPVTLRELEEKMSQDVASMDHFKHMAKVMSERMVASVKSEFASEAKIIKTEIDKLIKGLDSNSSAAAPANNTPAGNKKGRGNKGNNKENDMTEKPAAKPEPARGRENKRKSAAAATASQKVETKAEPKPAATSAKGRRGGGPNKKAKKEEPKIEPKVEPKVEPEKIETTNPKPTTGRGRRGAKKSETNPTQKKLQNENVPDETNKTDLNASNAPNVASNKKKEDANKTEKPTVASTATTTGTGRGRKRKNALTPVNSNRGTKVPKTVTTVAAKIITGSPGSPAKVAIAGSNLVNLSALSQPLPPQVVLPTTPLAAPQVQSFKSTAPPPQLIQLRPTVATAGVGVGQTMQIRPIRATGPSVAGGPRPQFFKIVGGKPVQISAANLHRLPASAITSIQPQQGRVMYMRAPGPASTGTVTSVVSSALATSGVTTLTSSGVAASAGNKIILLSNKGQAIPTSKTGGAPPSIVRVVSPNSVGSGIGGKLTLSPGSPTKLATLRPAGSSVPILLRTVAPRPAGGSPPIQLPMAPLPKSALNNAGDKKTDVASAKAIQVLLPKSPLPPQSAQSPNNAATSNMKNPGSTTTTTTTASGAFVWTNSTRANFKLSSRINFASLDKFKNVVNKDVHFILANIVTEDKSNEFSFRLHLKREPVKTVTSNADKKDTNVAATESYLELEAKAKVPTAQEWSLKVKTEPPVFLVSGGNFLSDFPATRIPKEIADKPFVDYELHIDKCSPTQVATGKGSVAKMAAAAAAAASGQPAAKRGRKVAAK